MSLLAPPSNYLQIEDRIDAIGQKYRVQRILRGAMLWITAMVVATFVGAWVAHLLGSGFWTRAVLGVWCAWAVFSTWQWFLRPLLIRPDLVEVARFIESRIGGLHNGLTNGLLLSRRDDLAKSPWLPEIFNEIVETTHNKPLGEAIKLRDLLPLSLRLLCVVVPLIAVALIFPKPFHHGGSQLLSPTQFVPKVGDAEIDVQPGDKSLVSGDALEITIVAHCDGNPKARVIFEKGAGADPAIAVPQVAELMGTAKAEAGKQTASSRSILEYTCRIEDVTQPIRYRVEVAGTQSKWYSVTIVQVKLEQFEFTIRPPGYTHQPVQILTFKPADISKANISVPQGSMVEMTATVAVPVDGAMLNTGAKDPIQMQSLTGGRRFLATFAVLDDLQVAFVPTLGKQLVNQPREEQVVIHCVKDQPPTIDMKWPLTPEGISPPSAELKIRAALRDDYGVASARVLMAVDDPSKPAADNKPVEMAVVHAENFTPGTGATEPKSFTFVLPLKPEQRKSGNTVRFQLEVFDNRDLVAVMSANSSANDPARDTGGPQKASATYTIKFEEPTAESKDPKDQKDTLRDALAKMIKKQRALHDETFGAKLDNLNAYEPIRLGQIELRNQMKSTAESFHFEPSEVIAQKILLKLYFEEAKDAVDRANDLKSEPATSARRKLDTKLRESQRHIINVLETLLANLSGHPTSQPSNKEGNDPLLSAAERLKKLEEALKDYIKKEQQILDQTTSLAKKPVDNWDAADKKKLEELKMAQEKLDAFMQEKVHDFSKNSEQDMANSSLLKQLMEVYSETTMAKDALKQKAAEIAVAAEENGIDNAKTLTSNIEKWLANAPDRTKWTQEDPLSKTDLNMPELPKQLEDLVGKLLEQQEDLFDEMEDANANWAGSFDKGIGWDAADGPIASMNAQGVTGNQLPNNNEMNGRSGEGRSGKSQGEFVEDHATGKGGRNTPTRLDPTPFQKGQVKDDSKDPTGGATGGGKMSGQGGEGLQGPVPPKQQMEMERLANKQAQLRNAAERLSLDFRVRKYDNFKLDEAIALMRRIESDLHANRYNNAMRKRGVTLDAMDTSRLLVSGESHVERDTTPAANKKLNDEINKARDAMKGEAIPGWEDVLKEYYKKIGR